MVLLNAPEQSEHDARAAAGKCAHGEHVCAALHDRNAPTAFGHRLGQRRDDPVGAAPGHAAPAVDDGRDDLTIVNPTLHLDVMVRAGVFDGIRQCLAYRDQQRIEIGRGDAVLTRESDQLLTNIAHETRVGWYDKAEDAVAFWARRRR